MSRKTNHVVCPYCQTASYFEIADLGFEEFECSYCEIPFAIPETMEEIPAFNLENLKAVHEANRPTHFRVMLQGEDGMLSCLKNGVPEEYADLVCEGFQSHYTEGQKCFLEPEETMADLRRMCDSHDEY